MARKRILVLESELLLSAGVRSLLTGQENLDVVSVFAENKLGLRQSIQWVEPEVIVMDEGTLNAHLAGLVDTLRDYPSMRLVVVDTGGNQIQVCDRQRILIRQLSDFLAVL